MVDSILIASEQDIKQYLVALQMGLGLDIDRLVYGDFENDADLEAELRTLQEENDDDVHSNRKNSGGARGTADAKSSGNNWPLVIYNKIAMPKS